MVALSVTAITLISCTPMKPSKGSTAKHDESTNPVSDSSSADQMLAERYFGTGNFGSKSGEMGRQAYKVHNLPGNAVILGVYPVKAEDPCHLVEMKVTDATTTFDLGDFTQAMDDRSTSFWQVPWMESLLDEDGTSVLAEREQLGEKSDLLRGNVRLAFFLHYLNTSRPLLTPFGELSIPKPTKLPGRLRMLKYESPD